MLLLLELLSSLQTDMILNFQLNGKVDLPGGGKKKSTHLKYKLTSKQTMNYRMTATIVGSKEQRHHAHTLISDYLNHLNQISNNTKLLGV